MNVRTTIPKNNGYSNLTPNLGVYKITASVSLKAKSITEIIALVNLAHKSSTSRWRNQVLSLIRVAEG